MSRAIERLERALFVDQRLQRCRAPVQTNVGVPGYDVLVLVQRSSVALREQLDGGVIHRPVLRRGPDDGLHLTASAVQVAPVFR